MVTSVDIETMGIPVVVKRFDDIAHRANDMQPLFHMLHGDFLNIERKQFESEGKLGSGGWPALKPETLRRKQKRGQDERILHATHALLDSLTQAEAAHHVFDTTADSMRVGTDLPYAEIHQNPRATGPLPKRPPVEFRTTDRRAWARATNDWVLHGKLDIRGSVRL